MIENLFINGCSFSEGNGICGELGLKLDSESEKYKWSYGAYLSRLLNLNHINLAEGGSSNRRICRTTMEWCCKNEDKMSNTFFIIQWSFSARVEVFTSFQRSQNIKEYWHQTHFGSEHHNPIPKKQDQNSHTQLYILSLYNFFKVNNLSFLFLIGDDTNDKHGLHDGYFRNWIDKIDFFTPSFVDFADGDLTPNKHPSKKKNEEFAQLLYDNLESII